MDRKIALVKDGVVKNVIVADGGFSGEELYPGFECIDVSDVFCGPGMLYVGGQFTQPPEESEEQ